MLDVNIQRIRDLRKANKMLQESNGTLRLHNVELRRKNDELHKLLNTPMYDPFIESVKNEILHQGQEWLQQVYDDATKTPDDWFDVMFFLSRKIILALDNGDTEKALHHCISTSALLGHWHQHIKKQAEPDSETKVA